MQNTAKSLYEALSVAVDRDLDASETRLTHADTETVDDDSTTAVWTPSSDDCETLVTRVENETTDDGSPLLDLASRFDFETLMTKKDTETVDDMGSEALSRPMF